MSKPTITIFLNDNTWYADMRRADDAEEIQELFGTYILPTPFTAQSSATKVSDVLTQRNPGHEILVPF